MWSIVIQSNPLNIFAIWLFSVLLVIIDMTKLLSIKWGDIFVVMKLSGGQRVYVNEANVLARAAQPSATTLTAFFRLCEMFVI